jgi:hypothetical protein
MKLYEFTPNDFGSGYFICAENKTKAHEALLIYLLAKSKTSFSKEHYLEEYKIWKNVNPNDLTTFPNEYTLEEFEPNIAVEFSND